MDKYDKIVVSVDKRGGFQYDSKDKIERNIMPKWILTAQKESGERHDGYDSEGEVHTYREVFLNAKR